MNRGLLNPGQTDPAEAFPGTGEFVYTQADFETISALIYAHAGIVMTHDKAMLIFSRFTKLLRGHNMRIFADYVELIRHDSEERRRALEALTTNHTRFFRENHHFDHFAREVRPSLIEKLQAKNRVRIWSAGSSTGEEIYSLAMIMLGTEQHVFRQILRSDLAILATDLAQRVLNTAIQAEYPLACIGDIPAPLAQQWVKRGSETFRIDQRIRDLVRFRRLNLLDPWPIKNQFDVIFCRNVMIYFDDPTKEMLLGRYADHLRDGGYLYIGHSERVPPMLADRFAPVGQTIFRKIGR